MSGLRDSAITRLNAALAWATTTDAAYIERFMCVVQLEDDVRDGRILREDVAGLISQCRASFGNEKTNRPEDYAPRSGHPFSLYPNPASNALLMQWSADSSLAATVWISDISGRHLRQDNWMIIEGFNQLTIDVSNLQPGMYLLDLLVGETLLSDKFVVLR